MSDQVILFCLLGIVFGLLIWGKIRYDLVAFGALVLAIIVGVVPQEEAFAGFGHHATVIIALGLIVSRGLSRSGAIEILARQVVDSSRRLPTHIGIMAVISAALSSIMNNVAALALLMPLDMQAAAKAKRSPALSLMPLSFASILGGMITSTKRFTDEDHLDFLHTSALTGGLEFQQYFADRSYNVSLSLYGSQVQGSEEALVRTQRSPVHFFQRPDADYITLDSSRTSLTGYGANLSFGKFSF